MARHYIESKFWTDEKVQQWDSDTKLLALYLLTNPHSTTEGFYQLKKMYMMADLGWASERFTKPFGKLLTQGFAKYDEGVSVVLLPNSLKYNSPDNRNQAIGALKQVKKLPRTELIYDFLEIVKNHAKKIIEVLEDPTEQLDYNSLPRPLDKGSAKPSEGDGETSNSYSYSYSNSNSKEKDKSNPSPSPKEMYNEFAPVNGNGLKYDEIKKRWNEAVPEPIQIRNMTQKRKEKLRNRYKEDGFSLREIVEAIQEQPFLMGQNDRGWTVDFTWLIKNQENWTKVVERSYKDNKTTEKETQLANLMKDAAEQDAEEEANTDGQLTS